MKIVWATDIHLDFITNPRNPVVSAKNLDTFCGLLNKENPELVLLTGDISIAPHLRDHLLAIETRIKVPLYFVLGNHDFWNGDIETVRATMTAISSESERLRYLSAIPYVPLSNDIALVGHDGWYDGFNGQPNETRFNMNDWYRISDFVQVNGVDSDGLDSPDIVAILNVARRQATKAARHVADGIKSCLTHRKPPKKVIIATHFPPFVNPINASKDTPTDLYPWYSSKTMGDMLLAAANAYPKISFEVFCGHIHAPYEGYIAPNLLLRSGAAEYAAPNVQGVFNITV